MKSLKRTVFFRIALTFHGIRALVMQTKYLFVGSEDIQQVVIWEENLRPGPSQPA